MKLTLITALSLVALSVAAQNNAPPPPSANMNDAADWDSRSLHFGLNFTPGIYWVSPNSSNNKANGASLGYGYGLNLEFYFTQNYAFLLGMNISNVTAHYINDNANPSVSTVDSTITHSVLLQYLQLPLQLKLKTVPFGHLRYFGIVGLDFGFLLKATDSYTTIIAPTTAGGFFFPHIASYSNTDVDVSNQTNFFQASFVIGGGVEYTIAGSTSLQASLTYNSCFTNMNSSSSSAVNIKGAELMLGILF